MSKLYLVDGSGYIFRAYYAIAPLTNSRGLPTNALFGFTRMFIKLLRDSGAEHIAVMFDMAEPTFRKALYSDYKANRKECPEDLVPQMPYFRKIVEALGIRLMEKSGVEADDIIGTVAKKFRDKVDEIVVVSGDKDLAQLVDEKITVWDPMRDVSLNPAGVREKFGVTPEQIIDYLALTGDSSDNVPGVKGIGPKTAVALINHFGTVENIIHSLEELESIPGLRGAASIKKKLESDPEMLRLSRKLVTLDLEVEPFNSITDLEEFSWRAPKAELLTPLFKELEFEKIISSVPNLSADAFKNAQSKSGNDFRIVTAETFPQFAQSIVGVREFAFDTETTSLDPLTCELVGISFSWEEGRGYFLPLCFESAPDKVLEAKEVRESLAPVFADSDIKKIGLNCKFDLSVLAAKGYDVQGISFDSMLASYVLNPDKRQHSLSALSRIYLGEEMLEFKELVGKLEHIGQVELEKVAEYACADAETAWRLKGVLDPLLGPESAGDFSTRYVFEKIEMPLIPVLSQMERTGIKVDVPFLQRLDTEFSSALEHLEKEIQVFAGHEFNLNSPKQLSQVLYDELGIPTHGIKKTQGGYSTDAGVLSKIADQHPIVERILEYREIFKLKTTYVDALQRLRDPKTDRIHTSYNQAVAATGRLSSSDPNLQNIPIRNPRGRQLRKAFIAENGYKFISADYSQIELRLLAHLSGDANLQRAFIQGEDIHLKTAQEIFGTTGLAGEELSRLRRVAKTINFGIIYGISAFRLSGELGVSRAQAQRYIDDYFARYPKVQKYFDSLTEKSERLGYVETLFGRRRFLKDIDISGRDAGYANRSLINAPIQGTAAEVIKLAMINLHRRIAEFGARARMVLQVHDELVFEVAEPLVAELQPLIVEGMERAVELSVPLKVDVRVGATWGEE